MRIYCSKNRKRSLIVFAIFFLLFYVFNFNVEAAVASKVLTNTDNVTNPINLDSYTGGPYTGLINKGSISYDTTYHEGDTYNSIKPAVSGLYVTDGITNYGTISESAKFANATISGYISNIAINVSSNDNVTVTNEKSGTINNYVSLSDGSSAGGIYNIAADLESDDGLATFTNSGTINNSVNLSNSSTYPIDNIAAQLEPSGSAYGSGSPTFTNSGTINNSVNLNDGSGAGGIDNTAADLEYSDSAAFINSGTINNSMSLSDSRAYAIDNIAAKLKPYNSATFTNSGTINNSVSLSNNSSGIYWIDNIAAKLKISDSAAFTNSGTINNSVNLSDNSSSAGEIDNYAADLKPSGSAYGSGSPTFTNSGIINNSVNLSDNSSSAGEIYNYAADLKPYDYDSDNFLSSATFINSGTINNSVNLSDNSSSAGEIDNYAADLEYSVSDNLTNSGTINNSVSLSDNSSAGMIDNRAAVLYPHDSSAKFSNSGTINNYVNLGGSSSADRIINYGADLYSSGSDNLTNSGTINNYVNLGGSSSAGEIYNYAAKSHSYSNFYSNTLTNSGTINNYVSLSGGSRASTIDNRAAVLESYPYSSATTLTNSGTINNSVNLNDGSGATEIGNISAYLEPSASATLTNSGTINNSLSLSGSSSADRINNEAVVLYPHNSSATFINSGTINVSTNIDTSSQTASGSKLTSVAADLYFNAPSGSITNTGTMSLSGYFTNPTNHPSYISSAILLYHSGSTAPITINSSGPISVSGHARALALVKSNAQLNSFGYVFNGDPTSSLRPIYLADGSTLNLNNTTLYAYAGNNLYFNKSYHLIENDSATSNTVKGSFSNIVNNITNPYINTSWYGTGRGLNAAVIFNYTLKNTTPTQISDSYALVATINSITSQITSTVTGNAQGAITSVADSQMKPVLVASLAPVYLSSYTEPRTRAFAIPLYTKIYAGNLGFSEEAPGIEFGIEHKLSENLKSGIFGGFASSSINFSSKGNTKDSEDQNYYNLGIYTTYNTDNYYISALANYSKVTSDFSGYTGPTNDIPTSDHYSSKDFVGKLEGGYKLNLNPSIRLTPLAGVEYDYYDIPSNTVSAYNAPAFNVDVNRFSKNIFKGYTGLNLLEHTKRHNITYFAYQDASIVRALNNTDITTNQLIQNSPVSATYDMAKTSFKSDLGFGVKSNNVSCTFNFGSELNSDYSAYSGWMKMGLAF